MANSKSQFIPIYSTLKADEIALIKSLLDSAKIKYYITNELPYSSAAVAQVMDIMVVKDSVSEAEGLLKEIIKP